MEEFLSANRAAEIKGVTRAAIYAAWSSGLLRYTIVADKRVTTAAWLTEYEPLPRDQRKGAKLKTRRFKDAPGNKPENISESSSSL